MSVEETKGVVRQVMERLDQRDVDGLLQYCTPDATWHGFAPMTLDNPGYREAIGMFLKAFPDSHFPIDDIVAEEGRAAVRHRLVGTHRAAFGEIAATGKSVTVDAIALFRVVNGKVAETWLNANLLGMLQQFGVVPGA